MARLDVNVVSSMCGKGLELEYNLLKALLNNYDVYINGYHYTNYAGSNFQRADVNIFLEVLMPNVFPLAKENICFPNSEWWDMRNDQFIPRFTKICCKTRDCERIWKERLKNDRPERVIYTGFLARDLYDPDVPREDRFLHAPGESEFKNTEAVIEAWKSPTWTLKPLPLTVLTRQKKYRDLCEGVEGITCLEHIPEDELKRVMNSHRFHLLPSAYEGFGHSLHEGIGCGALMITTAAPPMSEFTGVVGQWGVKVDREEPRALAKLKVVSSQSVIVAACKAIAVAGDNKQITQLSAAAREAFLAENAAAKAKILELVGVA